MRDCRPPRLACGGCGESLACFCSARCRLRTVVCQERGVDRQSDVPAAGTSVRRPDSHAGEEQQWARAHSSAEFRAVGSGPPHGRRAVAQRLAQPAGRAAGGAGLGRGATLRRLAVDAGRLLGVSCLSPGGCSRIASTDFGCRCWPWRRSLAGIGATWSDSTAWRITLARCSGGRTGVRLRRDRRGPAGRQPLSGRVVDTCARSAACRSLASCISTSTPDEVTGVLLVGDAQPFDLEVPADVQHGVRRLHLRAIGARSHARRVQCRSWPSATFRTSMSPGAKSPAIARRATMDSPISFSPSSSTTGSTRAC